MIICHGTVFCLTRYVSCAAYFLILLLIIVVYLAPLLVDLKFVIIFV